MARHIALMSTVRAGDLAWLLTFWVTLTYVTGLAAGVVATWQWLATWSTTGDALNVAWNVVTNLVSPDTRLAGEFNTRRAFLVAMAVVPDSMRAAVSAIARLSALRGRGSTGDGRVQNLGAAMAGQLFKACIETGRAVAHVTGLLTGMDATLELPATQLVAHVLCVHTTNQATFVSPTVLLLCALPVAEDLFKTTLALHAFRNLLAGHVHKTKTTAAFYVGGLFTRGTWA